MVQAPHFPDIVLEAYHLVRLGVVLRYAGGWHKLHPRAKAEWKERILKTRQIFGGFPKAHHALVKIFQKIAQLQCERRIWDVWLFDGHPIPYGAQRLVSAFLTYEDELRRTIAELEAQGIAPVTILRKRSEDASCAAV